MANMTLKELIDKIRTIPEYYGVEAEKEVVTDAWVADIKDRTYPPGSVIFQCESCNTAASTPEDVHYLSIHPDRITKLQ